MQERKFNFNETLEKISLNTSRISAETVKLFDNF